MINWDVISFIAVWYCLLVFVVIWLGKIRFCLIIILGIIFCLLMFLWFGVLYLVIVIVNFELLDKLNKDWIKFLLKVFLFISKVWLLFWRVLVKILLVFVVFWLVNIINGVLVAVRL